jgi:hypothetical protein
MYSSCISFHGQGIKQKAGGILKHAQIERRRAVVSCEFDSFLYMNDMLLTTVCRIESDVISS